MKTGHYVAIFLQKTGQTGRTAVAKTGHYVAIFLRKTGQTRKATVVKTGQFLYDEDRAELVKRKVLT